MLLLLFTCFFACFLSFSNFKCLVNKCASNVVVFDGFWGFANNWSKSGLFLKKNCFHLFIFFEKRTFRPVSKNSANSNKNDYICRFRSISRKTFDISTTCKFRYFPIFSFKSVSKNRNSFFLNLTPV